MRTALLRRRRRGRSDLAFLDPYMDDIELALFTIGGEVFQIDKQQTSYQDTNKEDAVFAVGQRVAAVEQSRSEGPDATQATATNRPVWSIRGISGDGGKRLNVPDRLNFIHQTMEYSIILRCSSNSLESTEYLLDTKAAGTTSAGWQVFTDSLNRIGIRYGDGDSLIPSGGRRSNNDLLTAGETATISIVGNSTSISFYKDGVFDASHGASSPITPEAVADLAVLNSTAGVSGFSGSFESCIVLNRPLSAEEIDSLSADLENFVETVREREKQARLDRILAADPDLEFLVPFYDDLALCAIAPGGDGKSTGGEHHPYQGAFVTDPVESVGDPVGAYRQSMGLEPPLVQTTDVARPVWGVEGIDFSPDDTKRLISNGDFDFAHSGEPWTVIFRIRDRDTDSNTLYCHTAITASDTGFAFRSRNDRLEMLCNSGSGFVTAESDLIDEIEGEEAVVAAVVTDSEVRFFVDQVAKGTPSWAQPTSTGPATLAFRLATSTGSTRLNAIISACIIVKRALTPAEIASLSTDLEEYIEKKKLESEQAQLDALLATDPKVLVFPSTHFETLWQDTEATVPAGVGDPVGAVTDPVTQEIVAVQTTEAARPIVGADGRTLIFDGTSQELRVPVNHPDATPHSVSLMIEAGSISNNDRAYGFGGNLTSIRALDSAGGGWQLRTSSGTNNVELARSIPPGEFHTLTGVHAPTSIVRYRGEEDEGNDGPPVDFLDLFIASRGGSTFAHMQCKWWAFFRRALVVEERITLEALS